jgi:hypothetical protein
MEDALWGWGEIGKYIKVHPRTAMRYEHLRRLPVRRAPGGGEKTPVFALKSELDEWLLGEQGGNDRPRRDEILSPGVDIATPVLDRILGIGRETKLYRRNYVMRFELSRATNGIKAHLEYEFELCNATDLRQEFVQEMTVDDSDHGLVERMSFSINGKTAYDLKKPRPTQTFIGYVGYECPKQSIAPKAKRLSYLCRASWIIHRSENDLWYNHMALPTVGVRVETKAPAGFEITRPFFLPGLVMKGEHVDIAWRKRF